MLVVMMPLRSWTVDNDINTKAISLLHHQEYA